MKKLCLLLVFYSITHLGFGIKMLGSLHGNQSKNNADQIMLSDSTSVAISVYPYSDGGLKIVPQSSSNVLIAMAINNKFGIPTNGISYSVGDYLPDNEGEIIYIGPANSFYQTGLNSATRYFFKAWEFDISNNYSAGAIASEKTTNTILLWESFSSNTPTGWTETVITDTGTDPELSYITGQTEFPEANPCEGYYMLKFNSYEATAGSKIGLETSSFSTVGKRNVALDFEWFESSGAPYSNDSVFIQYSINGGSWFDFVKYPRIASGDEGWSRKGIYLPPLTIDIANVKLRFVFYSDFGWDCLLDEVYVYEVKPEPSDHVPFFHVSDTSTNSLDLKWYDYLKYQPAEYYLIVGKTGSGSFYNPVDGTEPENDTDWSDGDFIMKTGFCNQQYIDNLLPLTTYHFRIYPYTNRDIFADYKTDGTIPECSAKTLPNPRDLNTTVKNTTQPAAGILSSIENSTQDAINIINIIIEDTGDSDGIPTIVDKIVLKTYITNTVDLDILNPLQVKVNGVNINCWGTYINSGLALHFISGGSSNLIIPDNSSLTVQFYASLNGYRVPDGGILSLMVDADDHGFVVNKYGSNFESNFAGGDIHSNDFTISVDATELHFVQNATNVLINTDMSPSPSIKPTDKKGNIDLDTIAISIIDNGAELINSPMEALSINGLALFDHLQFPNRYESDFLIASDKDHILGPNVFVNSSLFNITDHTLSDIMISEVSDPKTHEKAKFVELYNPTESTIDLGAGSYYLCRKENGTGSFNSVGLSGTIASHANFVCILDDGDPTSFENFYGQIWDQKSTLWNSNGNDSYYLFKGGNENGGSLIDIYGIDGENGFDSDWEYTDSHAVRKRSVERTNSIWTASEWVITPANADQMSPGKHKQTTTWQGGKNTDWNTPSTSNWSEGFVPDASNKVIIPTMSTVYISEPAACDSIQNNGSLTVNAGQTFTVGTIQDGLGSYSFQSDITSGPSSFLHQTNGLPANFNSSFADLNKWYLISSPISNASSNMFSGQYLDYWNETTAHWVDITSLSTNLTPGKGYSLKKTNDHSVSYFGLLNNGDITISNLHYTSSNPDSLKGWNLLGNPYPSVLDFKKIDLTGVSAVAGVSVWPHNETTSSSYINYSQGGGGNDEARYIQPGQGFMFQLTADNQSLTFTNDARTHKGLASFDKGKNKTNNYPESLRITVKGEATTTIDETYISFREGATTSFDSYYDIHKLFGATANPHIFSYINMEENEKAAIQSFPQPDNGDIIHLGLRIVENGLYKLQFSGMNTFAANQAFILIDNKSNDTYSVRKDSIITFYHERGDSENRFDLLFEMTTGLDEINDISDNIFIYYNDNNLYIRNLTFDNKNTNIGIFDILGQKLMEEKIGDATGGIPVDLPSAYYIIQIQSENEMITKKVFIP
jgi:hypothetical protein